MSKPQCNITLFFEESTSANATLALTNLLPYLKTKNYQTIVLEENQNKSPKDIFNNYKFIYYVTGEQESFIKYNYLFLEKAINSGFSIKGIDLEEKAYQKSEELNAQISNQNLMQLNKCIQSLKYKNEAKDDCLTKHWQKFIDSEHVYGRSKFMAKNIDKLCSKTKTDIVGIFGWVHGRITENLYEMGYKNIDSIFIHGLKDTSEGIALDDFMMMTRPLQVKETLFRHSEIVNVEDFPTSYALESYIKENILGLHNIYFFNAESSSISI